MEKYNYIRATVRKAAVRLTALDMIKCAGVGLIFGLVMALVVSVVGIFYPVMFVKQYGYLACVLGAVSGAVYAIFKRTKMGEAALKIDRAADLKERVTTAYELGEATLKGGRKDRAGGGTVTSYEMGNKEDEIARAVVSSAFDRLKGVKVAKLFPVKVNVKMLGVIVLLIAAIVGTSYIDTPAKHKAKEREQIASVIKEKKDAVKKLQKEIKNNKNLSKDEKERLNKVIEDTLNDFKNVKNKEELAKAEQKALKKLEQEALKSDKNEELMKSLAKAAVDLNSDMSKKEKQALKDQLTKKLESTKKAKDELNKALKDAEKASSDGKLSDEDAKKLKDALEKAAKELDSDELAELAKQVGNNLTKEQLSEMTSAMNKASASQMMADISDATMSVSSANASAANSGQNSQNNKNNSSGNANGNGNMQSNNNGAANGQGNAGQGNGNGGAGAGRGGGWNYGSKNGKEKKGIYDGDYVSVPDKDRSDDKLKGKNTNGESYTTKGGPSVNWSGTKVDYHTVIGDYENKAYERIEKNGVPYAMQEYVRDYFSELNN